LITFTAILPVEGGLKGSEDRGGGFHGGEEYGDGEVKQIKSSDHRGYQDLP